MSLLDDLGTATLPPSGARKTYTAPEEPAHLPSFLQGLEPVSDDELQKEWARQEQSKPSVSSSQPVIGKQPGGLLMRLAQVEPSHTLSDIMSSAAPRSAKPVPTGRFSEEAKGGYQPYSGPAIPQVEASKSREAIGFEKQQKLSDAMATASENMPGGGLLFRLAGINPATGFATRMGVEAANATLFNIPSKLAPEEYGALKEGMGTGSESGDFLADLAGQTIGTIKGAFPAIKAVAPELSNAASFAALSAPGHAIDVAKGKETIPEALGSEVVSAATGKALDLAGGLTEALTPGDVPSLPLKMSTAAITNAPIGAGASIAESAIHGQPINPQDIATQAATFGAFGAHGATHEAPAPSDHSINLNKMVEALIGQESGGKSGAVSPTGVKGKYQITEANTREWTKKFLGKEVPRDELIGTPEEDIVGRGQIQEYYENNLKKYGDPRRAAKETALDWYGRGPHSVGPSPRSYAKQVVGRFDKASGAADSLQPTADSKAQHPALSTQNSEPVSPQEVPAEPIAPAPEEVKAQIDAAAHEAATSPTNDLPEPTPLQQQSGNYKKGHVEVAGFDISVENPAGSVRKGVAAGGKPWETEMKDHYGYIKGSTGADGDHLDAFIGPDPTSKKVFVVDQVDSENESRPFDEHKVILGATDASDAREIYKRNFSDDAEPRIQALTETTPEDLKSWISEGNPHEPFSESDVAKASLTTNDQRLTTDQHAITTGEQPANDLAEHPNGSSSGQTAETGSGDRTLGSREEPQIPETEQAGKGQEPGNNQPLPEEFQRQPLAIHSLGDETHIELTGKTPLKARYAVVEADDLQASHNENTFGPNLNYPEKTQTRDYSGTKEEQAKVIGNAENFKPQYIVTDDPSPVNGPPMVDASGNVAGGNGRTMTIKRVYDQNPEGAKAFKDLLIKKAGNFGLDPETIRGMKKPVIIRQLDETDLRNGAGSKLVDDLNDTPTQQSDALTQGVTTGRRMSPADVTEIASALQEGNSIRDALSTKASTDRVRDVLRRNGTITRVNAPRYLKADGTFTPEGVNLIEGAMMGRVIDDVGTAKILQGLGGNYAKKITEALHPLSVIEGAPGEWSLKDRIDKVLKYIAARGDMADKDFRSQPSMIEGQDITLDSADRAILDALDSPKIKTFKNFANDYAERIGGDIFNPNITPDEALAETVKTFGGQTGVAGAGTLASEVFPGASQLGKVFEAAYEQDIKPRLVSAARGMTEFADDIQKTFAPASRGPAAEETKLIMRDRMAELARSRDIAETQLEEAHKALAKLPKEAQYDFIDRNERGLEQPTPELEAISKTIAPIFESRIEKVHELAPGKLRDLIDNYFPHIWEDPKKATEVFAQIYAKRPFEGPKAFLKQRVHEYFADGIAAGLKPVSDNPIDLVMLKAHEVDRFIMAHEVLNEMKGRGLLKYVSVSVYDKAPTGYTKIDDKVSTVYGNPNIPISEYFDQKVMDGLNDVADALGISTDRRTNIGGKALGYAKQGTQEVVTRFSTPDSVLAHEIGHQLDYMYDLKKDFVNNPETKLELRKLADARFAGQEAPESFKRYVRKGSEKMAVMLESYIHAPELFKELAPKAYTKFDTFLHAHDELKPLTDLKPSLLYGEGNSTVNAGGMLIRGYYYAPEEAARLVNNYLSPGLRQKSGIFRAYLGLSNSLNQAQLGFSAFHLGFVTTDSITSGMALGIYEAAHGDLLKGAKTAVQAVAMPVTNMITGSKMLREWVRPGSQGEEIGLMADAMQAGGGRGKMDSFYQNSISAKAVKAFRSGNYIGGLLRLPFAGLEQFSRPIMEYVVPRMKAGAFANIARFELERNQAELDNMSPSDRQRKVREIMSGAWDSVDNRLGQLVYDNLFWDKAVKDLAMASVRSVGWNIGTFRELGGGLIDFGAAIKNIASGKYKDAEFTHRMSYVVAAPIIAGMAGGMINYLMTGQLPKELKDYFFPKSGGRDEQGNEARVSLPSYMKDIFAYENDIHDAFALKEPGLAIRTVLHKVNPEIALISEMLQNQDYYGGKIVGDHDNVLQKIAEHVGSAYISFGTRGILRNIENEGVSVKAFAPFIGITPAPKALNETNASKLMQQYLEDAKEKGGFQRSDRSDAREKAIHAFRSGKPGEARKIIREGVKAGVLTSFTSDSGPRKGEHVNDDIAKIMNESKMSYLQAKFKEKLDFSQAMNVYEAATPFERGQLRDILHDKWKRKSKEGANITSTELDKLRKRYIEVRNLPVGR